MKYLIAIILLTSCGSGYDFIVEREGIKIEGKIKDDKVDAEKAKAYIEIQVDKALK